MCDISTAALFNVVAVSIRPVVLYFDGGVGAYQMQNSTPAVPKHPQWVQISASLLLVLLLNILLQKKHDSVFIHNEFFVNQNKVPCCV